jgi:hypothetical protein
LDAEWGGGVKLSSLYIAEGMLPIPGTQRREMQFHAADGWQMDRLEDGRITIARLEPIDGGRLVRRAFTVERVPCTYVEWVEPVVVQEPEPRPATILPPKRRRAS